MRIANWQLWFMDWASRKGGVVWSRTRQAYRSRGSGQALSGVLSKSEYREGLESRVGGRCRSRC